MGYADPKFPLAGHCSVVYDGTLYVYSPEGFQALDLKEGADWKALSMDVSLTGAQCVMAKDASDPKLYIVGGRVNATITNWGYPGLMHYSFKQKKWDWVRAQTWNTQDRQNHAAVYLESSQKLLVYAGSQDQGNVVPSPETFLMSTIPPYNVQAIPSAGAPPSVKPMLMNMGTDSAVLVGGGAANTAVWKFSEAEGWKNMGVTLQQPIVNQEAVQCAIVSGKGKSQVLEKFDMSATPNQVDRILLVNDDGSPAGAGAKPGRKAKRVTVDNWPAYNGTYASTSPRSGYSLAQGDDGTTVASGGNQTDPIVIFNAKQNSWMNTTALFKGQQVVLASQITTTMSSTGQPTATSSPVPSGTPTNDVAAAAMPPDNKGKMLTVLGATLGTIFGIAAVLILILICLKMRKAKSKQKQGYIEKDRMSFADRGADFMKEAGGSVMAPHYNKNNDSYSSLAIIQGKGPSGHKKNMASDASAAGLIKKTSPLGYSDPVELSKFDLKPEPVQDKIVRQNSGRVPAMKGNPRARSSGWSRYFANNEATNLANVQPDRSTFVSDRSSVASQSQYTSSNAYSHRPSQHIAPLEIPKFDGQRLSRVASGSPTLGSSIVTLPHQVQPMQAELGRANSNGSSKSGISEYDNHTFRKPVESWTPVHDNHRASSNYTESVAFDNYTINNDGTSSYYPDGTSSYYPQRGFSSFYPGQGDASNAPDMRDSSHTVFPSHASQSAQIEEMPKSKFSSMYPSPPRFGVPEDRDSTVTVFPGPNAPQVSSKPQTNNDLASFYPPPRVGHDSTVTMFPGPAGAQDKKDGQSDMSWLNLGTSR